MFGPSVCPTEAASIKPTAFVQGAFFGLGRAPISAPSTARSFHAWPNGLSRIRPWLSDHSLFGRACPEDRPLWGPACRLPMWGWSTEPTPFQIIGSAPHPVRFVYDGGTSNLLTKWSPATYSLPTSFTSSFASSVTREAFQPIGLGLPASIQKWDSSLSSRSAIPRQHLS